MKRSNEEPIMPMTLEEFRRCFPDRPDPIPLEYAGKWIAVERDLHTVVAAHGDREALLRDIEALGRDDLIVRYNSGLCHI